MNKPKDNAVLNTTEKKRYQYSAEYFSRGAASELRNKINTPIVKGVERVFDKFRKSEEDSKKNKTFKNEIFKKGLLFVGLLGGVVLLFDKLNKLEINPSLKRGDVENNDYTLDEEKILSKIQGENGILPYLKRSINTNFTNTLLTGTKLITTSNPTSLPYEWHKHLTEGQRQNGIFGDVFRNLALATIWHVFETRGYGVILELFNLPRPVQEVFNVGMWKTYVKNPRQYGHVGRSLIKDSVRSAENLAQSQSNVEQLVHNAKLIAVDFQNFLAPYTNIRILSRAEVADNNNLSEIIQMIQSNDNFRNIIETGRFTVRGLRQAKLVVQTTQTVRQGGQFTEQQVNAVKTHQQHEMELDIDSDDIMELSAGNRYKNFPFITNIPFRGYYGFLKNYMDYIDSFDENEDKRVQLIKYNLRAGLEDNNTDKWRLVDAMYVIQTMVILGEYELYQALKSTNTQRALYQDFFGRQMVDDYVSNIAAIESSYRESAEQFAIDYANGKICLKEYINEIGEALKKLTEKPLENLKNDIRLRRNTYQRVLPYGEIKHVIEQLKRELRMMSVRGVVKQNLVIINNESLRDNFDLQRRANVDTNEFISGQQFGREYFNGSDETVYSSMGSKLKMTPYRYVALWKKSPFRDSPLPADSLYGSFAGWYRVNNGDTPPDKINDYYTFNQINGKNHVNDVGNGKIEDEELGERGTLDNQFVVQPITLYWHRTWKEDVLGVRKKFRYEMIENGTIQMVDVWNYYTLDGEMIFSEKIDGTQQESQRSQAAIFREEYDEQRIRDLYNTPIEVLMENLKDSIDYVEMKLDEEYKLRKQLIDEIYGVSDNGKLVFTL